MHQHALDCVDAGLLELNSIKQTTHAQDTFKFESMSESVIFEGNSGSATTARTALQFSSGVSCLAFLMSAALTPCATRDETQQTNERKQKGKQAATVSTI